MRRGKYVSFPGVRVVSSGEGDDPGMDLVVVPGLSTFAATSGSKGKLAHAKPERAR